MVAVVVHDECDGGDGDGAKGFWDGAWGVREGGEESAGGVGWFVFVAVSGRGADAECAGRDRNLSGCDGEDFRRGAFRAGDDGGCDVGDELWVAAAGRAW